MACKGANNDDMFSPADGGMNLNYLCKGKLQDLLSLYFPLWILSVCRNWGYER